MLNIGTGELFMVMLVVLLVFGPDRIPEIARSLGKALRAFQAESQKAASVLRENFDEAPAVPGVVDRPDPVPVPEPPAHAQPLAIEPSRANEQAQPLVREYEDT